MFPENLVQACFQQVRGRCIRHSFSHSFLCVFQVSFKNYVRQYNMTPCECESNIAKCDQLHQYKTKRKELEPPKVSPDPTSIPALTTTVMEAVEVSAHIALLCSTTATTTVMLLMHRLTCQASKGTFIPELSSVLCWEHPLKRLLEF